MPVFRVRFRDPRTPDEVVDADRVSVESGGAQVVLYRAVLVVGRVQEVVARRVSAALVAGVDEEGT